MCATTKTKRTVYDGLSRPVSTWIGTDDAVSGEWSPTNSGGGMLQVTEAIYDNGGVGDSNVTQFDTIFDGGPSERYTTDFKYDFRNRRIGARGPDAVAVDVVVDNLGQVTEQQTGGLQPPLLAGYRTKIVDGNHLRRTDRRIGELRELNVAPLPGQALVVFDPQYRLVLDVLPCEDGHAQERSLLPELLGC